MKQPTINPALVFLCFSVFCFSFSSSVTSDGLSLLALKSGISDDPNHALISWSDSDTTPCNWAGITCDASHQKVVSISLSSRSLTGYIPSEIGALSFLTSVDLSNNSFGGPLPHQITALRNLVRLDVSSNNFNGSLPESLSNLTRLSGTLNLSYNAFSGSIPASFGLFPVMVSLDLRHNNLTGKVPPVGSLLNQGPTAFSGNPYLCGFPLINNPCSTPEAQNPEFSNNNPASVEISSNRFVRNAKTKSWLTTVSVISGIVLIMAVVLVAVLVIRTKCKKTTEEDKTGREDLRTAAAAAAGEEVQKGIFAVVDEGFRLELEDLLRASAYVLGKSRSGIVYKVVVCGGKEMGIPAVVAVRRLSEAEWRLKEFEAEVEAMGRVQHPNIVRLKAYYYSADEKLLISEFVRNGSLHNALHGPVSNLRPMSWLARLRIVRESARGLAHIHESSQRKYVHGNIRSSKILLDDDLKPYISGFGLSRLIPVDASKSANSTTLNSYVAPEARESSGSKLTQKCDVYAFGVVILEILTGRLPDNGKGVEGLVRNVFREGRPPSEILDPALLHEVAAKKQVVSVFHIALSCTEMDPVLRPRMRMVSDNLDCIELQ